MATKHQRKLSKLLMRRAAVAGRSAAHTDSERELLAIPRADWAIAKRRERLAKAALRTSIEAAAAAHYSTRQVRRLITGYRINPSLLAFLPRKCGPPPGGRRLDPEREALVEEAVDHWMASREPLPISRAVEEVTRWAKAAGLRPVARDSIAVRVRSRGAYQSSHSVAAKLCTSCAPTLKSQAASNPTPSPPGSPTKSCAVFLPDSCSSWTSIPMISWESGCHR